MNSEFILKNNLEFPKWKKKKKLIAYNIRCIKQFMQNHVTFFLLDCIHIQYKNMSSLWCILYCPDNICFTNQHVWAIWKISQMINWIRNTLAVQFSRPFALFLCNYVCEMALRAIISNQSERERESERLEDGWTNKHMK